MNQVRKLLIVERWDTPGIYSLTIEADGRTRTCQFDGQAAAEAIARALDAVMEVFVRRGLAAPIADPLDASERGRR